MIDDFLQGLRYALSGLGDLNRPGLRRYVALPLLINLLVFGLVIAVGIDQFSALLEWLLPQWLDWLRWLLWPLFALTILVAVFFSFTLVANLIGAPFNGLLAEKLETQLTGVTPDSGRSLMGEIGAAFATAARKLVYLALRALPLLILTLIPVVNLTAPFLWFAFAAWMLAIEYGDAPMGNHGLAFAEQRRRLAANRALSLGFGTGMALLTLIPILNFAAMPAGVNGATRLWVERLKTRV
ncbi:MAG: sulfate transporter CysZ [Ectothiorhodospiraceae bacterium]|jgi:CysZ protein|nr:sulfate transporter CysZ [Ectothiorhodospiraceae bacterium]